MGYPLSPRERHWHKRCSVFIGWYAWVPSGSRNPSHKAELGEQKTFSRYCAYGGRSALAAKSATEMGMRRIVNLTGGFIAWTKARVPISERSFQRSTMVIQSSMNFRKLMISGAIVFLIDSKLHGNLLPEFFWPWWFTSWLFCVKTFDELKM